MGRANSTTVGIVGATVATTTAAAAVATTKDSMKRRTLTHSWAITTVKVTSSASCQRCC